MALAGSFRALFLFDIAEEIDLAVVRQRLGQTETAGRSPRFRLPAPQYVRFENPPVIFSGGEVRLESGEEFSYTLRFFEYGVVSVELLHPFAGEWAELLRLNQRLVGSADMEQLAAHLARQGAEVTRGALKKPSAQWLSEDYYVIHLREVEGIATADGLRSRYSQELAQLVRADSSPLSESEQQEVARASLSYYPSDLLIAGWTAAIVFDTDEGALATTQLLEFANTQLLEFRFYDEVLSEVLRQAYDRLDAPRSWMTRWRYAREATRLNSLRLEITELTERTDNALKFIGDMFYARAYRAAAERIGVNDYRRLVEGKLATARDLYEFMVNEFHQSRAFVLELAIVVILVIDLVVLFARLATD